MTDQRRFVVIGGGQAGGRAVEALRRQGFAGDILLVGAERHPPYERPPLSKELLDRSRHYEFPFINDLAWYAENNIDLRLGVEAREIDRAAKRVLLSDGSRVPYDKLLIATGARLRRLVVPGAELDGVLYLRNLDEARAIDGTLDGAARVAVIGGGFIGLELAAAARKRGAAVTVIEMAERLLGRAVLPEVAEVVAQVHRRHGVHLMLGTGVEAIIEKDGRAAGVQTTAGAVAAELVIVGVGILPDSGLAEAAGLALENGIAVDEHCRTSDADIFAAGDVAAGFNPLLGRRVRQESWQNAQNQGINAARNMLGEDAVYAEAPWFWTNQFDMNLQTVGMPQTWDRVVHRGDQAAGKFTVFQMLDGRLVAATTINNPRDVLAAKRLVGTDRQIDAGQLADPAVPMKTFLG